MKKLYSKKTVLEIINDYEFHLKKNFGQNFLIDKNFVDKIIDSADIYNRNVIEIGPGIGVLTNELIKKSKKVIAVEVDKTLIPILKDQFDRYSNFHLINKDILKVDLKDIQKNYFSNEPFCIISNVPYYITTPIIEKIFLEDIDCSHMTLMVQKEVSDRMIATKNSKNYGSLSLFVKFYSDCSVLFNVKKTVFMPQPKVDSSVVSLKMREYSSTVNKKILFSLIHSGFIKRRKNILNSLSSVIDKKELKDILDTLNLDTNLRAENLDIDDYINITNHITKIKGVNHE